MDVKISFNTEKESLDDLKKLISALQDLVNKREKNSSSNNSVQTAAPRPQVTQPQVQQSAPQPQANNTGNTAGGGRLSPYVDMSDTMSKIFSGSKF
ncbi:MAG: hypothetical protein AABX19_00700 [Nanoarchaeota archaeon]